MIRLKQFVVWILILAMAMTFGACAQQQTQTTDGPVSIYCMQSNRLFVEALRQYQQRYGMDVIELTTFVDENGADFVYLLRERQRPYGLEYYVSKQNVTVYARDAVNAAIARDTGAEVILRHTGELEDLQAVWPIER